MNSPARPEKFFKIGEVMQFTGLSRQTLHNYTMMGLIAECRRTESGHRLYPESVFDRLGRIALLKRHRTLREVRLLLEQDDRAGGPEPVLTATGAPTAAATLARPARARAAAPPGGSL